MCVREREKRDLFVCIFDGIEREREKEREKEKTQTNLFLPN